MATESRKEVKIDVLLGWQDFVHYLEEAKYHNGDFSEERDWYRLNPFEILQLGCESIIENGLVSKKIGTILVGIENITPYLHRAPRLFRSILEVLVATLNSERSSLFMWMRCWKIVVGIKSAVYQDLRLYLQFIAILWEEKENIETLCQNQASSIRGQVTDIYRELKEVHISVRKFITELGLEDQIDGSVPLQIHFITERYGSANFILMWRELGVGEFIKTLLEYVSSKEVFFTEMLKVLEIFVKIISEKDNLNKELMGNRELDEEETSESILDVFKSIFAQSTEVVHSSCNLLKLQTSSPAKILTYISAIFYSTFSETSTLTEVWKNACIVETLQSLARFANHVAGDDSRMAANVFGSAVEFLTTAAEFEIPQYKASLVLLPNILSPVLECRDGRIISKALEFGALALHSKHQKTLLGEGLWHIEKCQQLFKPLKEIKNHTRKCELRIEAVLSSISILDELLGLAYVGSSLVAEKEEMEGESVDKSRVQSCEKQAQQGSEMAEECKHGHDIVEELQNSEDDAHASDSIIIKDIHLLLFELACSMIKAGRDIVHTFAGVIPILFTPSYLPDLPKIPNLPPGYFREFQTKQTAISWKVDKKDLAVKVLDLCIKCMNHGTSTPFQICSVMLPKLARNISKNRLSDAEKLDALKEFIDLCMSKAHERNALNGLVTHGLNLISMLMPTDMDVSEMKTFLPVMLKSLKKILDSISLLFLSSSCGFLMSNFPDQNENLKDLFSKLLQKGKKNDIRYVHQLSAPWLKEPRFHFTLDALFDFAAGTLKSKQIEILSEILSSVVDIEKRLAARIEEDVSYEEHSLASVQQLTTPIIDDVSASLRRREFDQKCQESIMKRVSNLILYKAFFEEELVQRIMYRDLSDCSADTKIPTDVKQDVRMMALLKSIARRIGHMQIPRYQSLRKILREVIKNFMQNKQEGSIDDNFKTENVTVENQIQRREKVVENYLNSLPQNRCLYDRLLACGYKEDIWSNEIEITVTTDGSLNTEENLRQTLLASFTEYTELLKQLGVPMVKIEGKYVKISDIFSDDLTINDLKGRRAIVVKAIDNQLSKTHQSRIHERKLQLLSEEERIENDLDAKSQAKLKPTTFKAKINTKFFDCASCCLSQIIGCYAPNGDHCERPLEIGMRYDSAFASIYDDSGLEIENAELLFMDQGVLVFRAYSNGHPYDTSQVWTDLFEELLDNRDVIPAIILPYHLPNRHTWESIRRISPTILTGVILTCDFDFSPEWKTYYDSKPESARCGKDIVLNKGFKSSKTRPGFSRQFSIDVGKDLGGMIFDDVMQALMKDEALNRFRFLGGAIAEYISEFIESGKENQDVISNIFNYDRWKDKTSKSESEILPTKGEIISALCSLVRKKYADFISKLDLKNMFKSKRRQFFQLKRFQEKLNTGPQKMVSNGYFEEITAILKSKVKIFPIDDLPLNVQEEVMHWIFGNEDRVWRNRGGRDGYETIEQYLNFLSHIRNSKQTDSRLPAFPGVLAVVEHDNPTSNASIQVKNIAGYAVGEYVEDLDNEITDEKEILTENPAYYEIVTAWVHPDYRKMNISVRLYLEIFKSVTSSVVAFDVLQGSTERILKTSGVLKAITTVFPLSMVVHSQEKSYDIAEEQFERFIIKRRPVKYAALTYEYATRFYRQKYVLLVPIVVCLLAILWYYCANMLS